MKKLDKKAFTLIELLVVVAVIGILVLLGAPRFLGYSQRAEDARIQHDVKVMEQEVGTVLSTDDDDFNRWEDNSKDFNQLAQDNELFEKGGPVAKEDLSIDETYKVIPEEYKDKINTKLKGTFYANIGVKVYYEDSEPGYSDEEIQDLIEEENYIPIATAEDLDSIRSNTPRTYGKGTKWEKEYTGGLGKHYVQVANIDLSKYSEEGWNPIGTDSSSFTGTYDGGNYVIRGLEVKGEEDYQGLFGHTKYATISNVGLIDNKVTGIRYVGGLVGRAYNKTEISNSYATGSVEGTDKVGGLVGEARQSIIENSYATGSVTGEDRIGGLVGRAEGSSTTISNSYATGSVTGSDYVGGLVGVADNSTIENSYATGPVEGKYGVGGLVGRANDGAPISNSYWDKDTTRRPTSSGQDKSFGKTTDEMKQQTTYTDWDFVNVWKIDEGNDYPRLR